MDQVQSRVQNAITSLLEKLDREYLRQIQGDMYRCNAKCCDDESLGMDRVQRCIEGCSAPLTSSQKYIEGEISNFQNRLQRCAYQCQDNTRDKVTPSSTEAEMAGYKSEMETCIIQCADDHICVADNMLVRMRETLKVAHGKQQQPSPVIPQGGVAPGKLPGLGGLPSGVAPSFPRQMPAGASPLGMPMGPRLGGDE